MNVKSIHTPLWCYYAHVLPLKKKRVIIISCSEASQICTFIMSERHTPAGPNGTPGGFSTPTALAYMIPFNTDNTSIIHISYMTPKCGRTLVSIFFYGRHITSSFDLVLKQKISILMFHANKMITNLIFFLFFHECNKILQILYSKQIQGCFRKPM